ncbi:cyclic nucleotide-binding domain-containing protein [Aeromicrobium chenweiae]|uniref:Cyclic nucleotide-binding domain-containing protein n=1 Tax=Aeromicrobium chenweiae TaxID=2079793 RepID=A0A2S0WQ52_9ACTN|nr:cyclic nucleotide-binding domain-containing protein [Aeromicrobium chenweiae]AWB93441.1 cyclic nucleotide-binding domain-containing protein [Aeromicrobium chenweiae]TGN34433.1 cyclic nucleotide-binding domain-containing protein [Aeromicrobium chenweiae]
MLRKPKADPEVVDRLTQVTEFDADIVTRIATVGTLVNIPGGWSIIMESTPADSAYIVLDGTVEIRKGGQRLASLGPGAVFGEIALVNHRLRNASVVASSPISAVRLGEEALRDLLEHDAGFADTMRSIAEARLGAQ